MKKRKILIKTYEVKNPLNTSEFIDTWVVNYDNFRIEKRLYDYSSGSISLENKKNKWINKLFSLNYNNWNKYYTYALIETYVGSKLYDVYAVGKSIKDEQNDSYELQLVDPFKSDTNAFNFLEFPILKYPTGNNTQPQSFGGATPKLMMKNFVDFASGRFPQNTQFIASTMDLNNFEPYTIGNEITNYIVDNELASKVFFELMKKTSTTVKLQFKNDDLIVNVSQIKKNKNPISDKSKGVIRKNTHLFLNKKEYRIVVKYIPDRLNEYWTYQVNNFDNSYIVLSRNALDMQNFARSQFEEPMEISPFTDKQIKDYDKNNNINDVTISFTKDISKYNDYINIGIDNSIFKYDVGDIVQLWFGGKLVNFPITKINDNSTTNDWIDVQIGNGYNSISKIIKKLGGN